MPEWQPTHPELDCLRINKQGDPYEEFSCLYPGLGQTYTTFEIEYNPVTGRDYMREHPFIPIVACMLYGLWITLGRAYFSDRKAWSWRTVLAFWNLGLSVFSGIGFLRTGAQLAHNLKEYSLEGNLCLDPASTYGSGSTGLWVQLFIISKFPELLDTFFIVIHKKPLIFLHWYHHVTVLLYCWHSYVTSSPAGLFFVVMNYAVHSIMYFYYFLMAVKLKPKWMNAMVITVAQISQMVVGVAVTLLCFYYYKTVPDCMIRMENNVAALIMYGSYLLLFLQFFIRRYFGGAKGANKKKQKTDKTNGTTNGASKEENGAAKVTKNGVDKKKEQ